MTVYEITFDQNIKGSWLKSSLKPDLKPDSVDLQIREKKDVLESFNPDNSVWITTDIKSMHFLLNQLKKKKSDLNENSVMRAKELWSFLFNLSYPDHHTVDRTLLSFIYSDWAKSKKLKWQRGLKTGNLLCHFMSKMAHLLKHPLRESLMEEWIKTFPKKSAYERAWRKLAVDFWTYLEQKKIIESSWASAFLLDNIPFNQIKSSFKKPFQNIVFDLGFDTNKVELKLIQQICSRINTTVLIPFCFEEKHQEDIDELYDWINIKKTFLHIKKPATPINSLEIKKFGTPLAEVKDISYQIKKALKEGVSPKKISVLAPRIEDYWTSLKSYLKKENIPVNKNETISLISFPFIQLWLAKLWTHLSILKPEYLQTICSHQKAYTNFSQLNAEFLNVKEIEKWPKRAYTKNHLRKKDEVVLYPDFIKWAKALLSGGDAFTRKHLEECLKAFSKVGLALKALPLKWEDYVNLLEYYLSLKEIEIKPAQTTGINCLSFNALSWLKSDLIYIAGLSEQNLKNEEHSSLSFLEAESITRDLGFFIKTEANNKLETIISCFIHQKHKKLILSFSTSDFLGKALNPSYLWLKKATKYRKGNINDFDTAGLTTWDEQQRKTKVKEILVDHKISPDQIKRLEQSLLEDIGHKVTEPFFKNKVTKLSPTSLESYIKCPFIFTAQKIFSLWEGTERDMDIPPLEKGRLIHKLFETLKLKLNLLKNEKSQPGEDTLQIIEKENIFSKQEILQIIEDIKNHKTFRAIQNIHPIIWEKEKARLLKKALTFLKQEKERELLFKNYRTLALEKDYQCYWNFVTKSLSEAGDILFRGKIDRIDSDNHSYQITDYKGRLAKGSVVSSWEVQKNFQMAFYTQVLEQGFASLPALPVKSALYLSYKNFEYQGMALKEPSYINLLGGPRKRSLISEEQKKNILEKVNQQVNLIILDIQAGLFRAKPKEKTLCEKCHWRKICRATHLN